MKLTFENNDARTRIFYSKIVNALLYILLIVIIIVGVIIIVKKILKLIVYLFLDLN